MYYNWLIQQEIRCIAYCFAWTIVTENIFLTCSSKNSDVNCISKWYELKPLAYYSWSLLKGETYADFSCTIRNPYKIQEKNWAFDVDQKYNDINLFDFFGIILNFTIQICFIEYTSKIYKKNYRLFFESCGKLKIHKIFRIRVKIQWAIFTFGISKNWQCIQNYLNFPNAVLPTRTNV